YECPHIYLNHGSVCGNVKIVQTVVRTFKCFSYFRIFPNSEAFHPSDPALCGPLLSNV
ncbi:unnamed protein product, partial [Laminaria digitata]